MYPYNYFFQFSCFDDRRLYDEEMIELKNQSDFCHNLMAETDNGVKYLDKYRSIDITFKLNDTERVI